MQEVFTTPQKDKRLSLRYPNEFQLKAIEQSGKSWKVTATCWVKYEEGVSASEGAMPGQRKGF